MDVKLAMQSASRWSLALVLTLGQISLATADDEVTVVDADVTSTIFITDDAPNEPPVAPASAEGEIVFVEDAPAPSKATTKPAPAAKPSAAVFTAPQTSAHGDLKVVTDTQQPQQQPAKTAVLRPITNQQPLAPLAQQPAVPKATLQTMPEVVPTATNADRDQPGDIQIAVHAEPTLVPAQTPRTKSTSPEVLLINAHKLSLEANTAAQYTEIIQSAAEALRHGIKGDKRGFAHQLSSWALNRRGQLRAEAGERELADADFQTALDFNPRNWRALHNRGVSHAEAGNFADAFDDFNAVLQINPKHAKAYANRATLYVQARDLQAAIKDYEQAIQHDDKFATAHVGLGRVYHMLGNWDDAITRFSAAIEIDPARPDVICSRGDLHADMGNYGEALADYARTIELDPEFAHAYRNGAWLLATCPDDQFRDPTNAVLGAEQALEYSYGERHVALDTLAAAYASNGQFDEAVVTITQAVDLAPEDAKFTYLSRLQLYQDNQPFRTEPVGDVSQVIYEASDQ